MIRRFVLASLGTLCAAELLLAAPQAQEEKTPSARVAASPRAAEEIAAGSGKVRVEYSRPFVKGRKVFGGLVPWGKVWRTGANAATTLTTDVDLTLGSAIVPKGAYTLYTLPDEKSWKLIVNRQTGQWGTDYDPQRDLVRMDMKVSERPDPVEAFTISLVPEDAFKGSLRLSWDRLVLSVAYAARK